MAIWKRCQDCLYFRKAKNTSRHLDDCLHPKMPNETDAFDRGCKPYENLTGETKPVLARIKIRRC